MSTKLVYGISNVKMGPAGVDGAMGATLTDITKLVADSVNINFPEPTETDIIPEELDSPEAVLQNRAAKKITLETLNMDVANLPNFFGGSVAVVSAVSTFTPGQGFILGEQSMQFTTRPLQGVSQTWMFPRCAVLASIVANPSKTKTISIKLTFTVLQPHDGSGAILPDFSVVQQ